MTAERGDSVGVGPTSVGIDAYLNIKPTGDNEWTIHNLYIPEGTLTEAYWTDGVNYILIDQFSGSCLAFYFHVTADRYLALKNVSGSVAYLAYDGVIAKVVET